MEKNTLLKKGIVCGIIVLFVGASALVSAAGKRVITGDPQNDLEVNVRTDKEYYLLGEPVEITISVTNAGENALTIEFPSTCKADFTIDGYQWSYDKYCLPIIIPVTIPTGVTIDLLTDVWSQADNFGNQVSYGTYELDGWMVNYYWEGFLYPEIHGDPRFITITILGDFNGDCHCDMTDFTIFAAAWLSSMGGPNWNPLCDLDNSGNVDMTDFTIFASCYGTSC